MIESIIIYITVFLVMSIVMIKFHIFEDNAEPILISLIWPISMTIIICLMVFLLPMFIIFEFSERFGNLINKHTRK